MTPVAGTQTTTTTTTEAEPDRVDKLAKWPRNTISSIRDEITKARKAGGQDQRSRARGRVQTPGTAVVDAACVSAAELDEQTLAGLDAFADARSINLLLGAGASAAAGLPDWDSLAVGLLTGSGAITDAATARAFLARQDPALAAEAARASTADWSTLVRSVLYPDGEPQPAVLHLAAAGLASAQGPGGVGLFTLNFDLLLERALDLALQESGSSDRVFSRAAATPRAPAGSYEVHHLHGYVGPGDDEFRDVVLTLADFSELAGRARPWQVAALQEALQRGPLLLAGTSYRDPDIRQWVHELTADQPPPGGGVTVLQARQGLGLTRAQFDLVKHALAAQWQAIGVHPLLVHDHSDAAQAIREIPWLREPGYRNPQLRAGHLLTQTLSDFDALQLRHSAQLAVDLDHLRSVLGAGANLTLWLADGHGDIVRWAAHDRIYRDARQLRRVPAGWDSPWVAGQCLGRDDLTAQDVSGADPQLRRWRSVVAAPVPIALPGGPALSAAVLSSATPGSLETKDLDAWRQALTDIADQWADRLADIARSDPHPPGRAPGAVALGLEEGQRR